RIMKTDACLSIEEMVDEDLARRVARIRYAGKVGDAADGNRHLQLAAARLGDEARRVERHLRIDPKPVEAHLEQDVASEELLRTPLGEERVLRQAVAADAEARIADVVVCALTGLDRLDRGEQVDPDRFREQRPFVDERDVRGSVRVLEQLRELAVGW